MRILVIGAGGREHAMVWQLAKSEQVEEIFVAPGNGGTALEHKTKNIAINVNNTEDLLAFALEKKIAITIVGPEAPLANGIVDSFQTNNLKILGPYQQAAQLETSKAFAKAFMQKHNIPTADYQTFTDSIAAKAYLKTQTFPIVIKADGLAAGKGVVIAENFAIAEQAITHILEEKHFGNAGQAVVIEEFIQGEEASFIALVDGKDLLAFPTSQDHKRIYDQDKGPNTGGMGAYSPAPIIDDILYDQVIDSVIKPVIEGMAATGSPYKGFLYAGLMITPNNAIKVLEFNCRLGDPEAQVLLMRLQSDFLTMVSSAIDGNLVQIQPVWDKRPALTVVMASEGYPGNYQTGFTITGLPEETSEVSKVFHAGTHVVDDKIKTAGGRVLAVTALGETLLEAQQQAYSIVKQIHWENNAYYRQDIGWKALS